MEAFVQSDLGEITYHCHSREGVTLVDDQAHWTPLHRDFLVLANDEYGPDDTDVPNTSNVPRRGNY